MTDAGSSAVVAGVSAVVLESFGVDPFVIAMAAVGAVMLHAHSVNTVGRLRALLQVASAGVVGALFAQVVFDHFMPGGFHSRALLMLLAAFFGFVAFRLLEELAGRMHGVIGKLLEKLGASK